MEKTFFEILPLAIAATISPTGLLFVTMILSGKVNPKKNAIFFLLGSIVFLLVLGTVLMTVISSTVSSSGHSGIQGILDIGFGVLIILYIGKQVFFKKKEKKTKEKKERHKPYFIMGFLFMIINTSTLIPFIAACKIITQNQTGLRDATLLLVFLIMVTMLMISLPVLVSLLMPQKSDKVMNPIKAFMTKYGNQIAQVYFFIIALYLIYRGISGIKTG